MTSIEELIAKAEQDPAQKAALDAGREWVKDRIAREGSDWLYKMFIPVETMIGAGSGD